MNGERFEVESYKPFSESLIWQINRDFYNKKGIEAWSKGIVPHQITSNSLVGRTYAKLILAFLKDLASKGSIKETVYILELGAGHGRLGFHILKHLEELISLLNIALPPYCYVLTDIVEENLTFFKDHPQLQTYYKEGVLDYAYYDAINGKNIKLRYADFTINKRDLNQAIIAIGNYFFDSLPNDLFYIKEKEIWHCSVALHASQHPASLEIDMLLKDLKLSYQKAPFEYPYYSSAILNRILKDYQERFTDSYVFFPQKGIQCLENLKALSSKGIIVLSMDKGFHDLAKLDKKKKPDIVTHGSFSLWVNYHALGSYCNQVGGKAFFPHYSTFHLQVACLLFVDDPADYSYTNSAYQQSVNDFGPDDYNTIKKLSYENLSKLSLMHIIALLRLSGYDSTYFIKLLPRIKKHIKRLSNEERERIGQTLEMVWNYYFNINESQDMALNIAEIFFDLGFYNKALEYFQYSTAEHGNEIDTYYNKILCYYELRQDALFIEALEDVKQLYPKSGLFDQLHELDLKLE